MRLVKGCKDSISSIATEENSRDQQNVFQVALPLRQSSGLVRLGVACGSASAPARLAIQICTAVRTQPLAFLRTKQPVGKLGRQQFAKKIGQFDPIPRQRMG